MRAGASTTSCAAAPAARAIPAPRSFFLSLEDDLMRIFGSEALDWVLQKGLASRTTRRSSIAGSTRRWRRRSGKVEARNFEIRKNLLRFDDVMNDQRKVIYEERSELMRTGGRVGETIAGMRQRDDRMAWSAETIPPRAPTPSSGNRGASMRRCCASWRSTCRSRPGPRKKASPTRWCSRPPHRGLGQAHWPSGAALRRPRSCARPSRIYCCRTSSTRPWKEHLLALDHLRAGIGLRAYGSAVVLLTGPVINYQAADSFNRKLEKDVSTGNIPHIFSASIVYMFHGWEFASTIRAQAGSPAPVTQSPNLNAFAGYGIQRPNRVADPELSADQRSTGRWFEYFRLPTCAAVDDRHKLAESGCRTGVSIA